MSRQPSPGPSIPHVAGPAQVFQAIPPQLPLIPNNRQKSKTFTPGIAAGAEDVKYQAKYKELKRKVKEIEADNDKLQFKVLQAKKSINRMKIERAVLYDRLSQVPPSPDMNDRQPLPPVHSGPGVPPLPLPPSSSLHHSPYMAGPGNHQSRDVPMDRSDRAQLEYLHRTTSGPDTRPVQDILPIGSGVAPPPPPTNTLPSTSGPHSSSRHGPHDTPHQQLPPLLSKMAPSVQSHLDPPHAHGHPYSPQMPPQTGSSRTHSRSRGHHQASTQYPQHATHQHPSDSGQHLGSSPLPGEREREKSRRHEGHERTVSHSRHPTQPVTKNTMHSPPGTRMSSRIHQQHLDRSPVTQNELDRERERGVEMEHEWENDQRLIGREQIFDFRLPSPPFTYRSSRQAMERSGDYSESPSFKLREEQSYHRDHSGRSNKPSRSGTPLSGSGGSGLAEVGPPARPGSRDNGGNVNQYYDRDRTRPYAARQPPPEDEYMREERRPHSRDQNTGGFVSSERPYPEGRKRNHHEMELDGKREGDAVPATVGGSRKRVHQDHTSARGGDSQEEDEMDA